MTYSQFESNYAIAYDYLDEYQQRAMDDAISAFGFNEDTVNAMIYVWFGMQLKAFVNYVLCQGMRY